MATDKALEQEIINVITADEIITAAIQEREPENTQNLSWAEKYKDFDFVGAAGNKVKELIDKGKRKAKEFLTTKVKVAINDAIYKAGVAAEKGAKSVKQAAGKTVEAIEQTPDKIKEGIKAVDGKIQEVQMAHARDKFEKRKKRETFTSRKEDLFGAISFKIKSWKDKGKENFADMLAISRAYASVKKENVQEKYAQFKEDAQEFVENGVDKARKVKDGIGDGLAMAAGAAVMTGKATKGLFKAAKGRIIKGVKDLDSKIQTKQMAHARDKFEKRKKRETFTTKKEDLFNAISFKIKSWKDKGKENFADMLAISRAYASVKKENVQEKYAQFKEDAQEFVENGVEKAQKVKDEMISAAAAVGGAVVSAPGKTKEAVKKSAKTVAFKGVKGMRNLLDKASKVAQKGVENLDRKLEGKTQDSQNKDDGSR